MELLKGLEAHIYSVSELNNEIKNNLEACFSNIWIEGEVSNYYCHNNRHAYFDLKDKHSKIKVVMFYDVKSRLLFEIENGLHLILLGYVSVYEKRGEYQFIALDARPVGKGALILAFEQLKLKLEKKGYFDSSRKKPIPAFPKIIGAVTSTGGAVIKDMVSVLSRRFENFHLIVRNVNVQGPSSSEEICAAIDDLSEYGVDVIIIARGGGSLEDLWAFNTEAVADKVYNCNIPIISAIGHETDYTICDFVADLRAATPSVAAQVVIFDKSEVTKVINSHLNRLKTLLQGKINSGNKELYFITSRKIFKKPQSILINFWQEVELYKIKLIDILKKLLDTKKVKFNSAVSSLNKKNVINNIILNKSFLKNINMRLFSATKRVLELYKGKISILLKDLQSRSPVIILERGFALIMDEKNEKIIKSINEVKINQNINVNLKDGILFSKILNKIKYKFNKKIGLEV